MALRLKGKRRLTLDTASVSAHTPLEKAQRGDRRDHRAPVALRLIGFSEPEDSLGFRV